MEPTPDLGNPSRISFFFSFTQQMEGRLSEEMKGTNSFVQNQNLVRGTKIKLKWNYFFPNWDLFNGGRLALRKRVATCKEH